jgi:hypothetical protein
MHLRRHRRYTNSPSPANSPSAAVDVGEEQSVDQPGEQQSGAVDGEKSENSVGEQFVDIVNAAEESENPDDVPEAHRRIRRRISLLTRVIFFFLRLLCKIGLVRR